MAPKKPISHERRILGLALLSGLPATLVALALLWFGDYSERLRWTLLIFMGCFWLGFAFSVRHRVAYPLQTIANLLAALREGDYSIRARGARHDDALGEVLLEVNTLSRTLQEQRRGAVEAGQLLRTVMTEIDVSVFAFDSEKKLRLVNRAGERLLAETADRLLGRTAADLELAACLEGDAHQTRQITFPGGAGRWGVRRSTFWERGLPHHLLVVADLSHALREEERQAWQRLVRVLGHELNNSLAPIKSMGATLEGLLRKEPLPADLHDDLRRGLAVISSRAESLSRFMEGYSILARLPKPRLQTVRLSPLIGRVVRLEMRKRIEIEAGPDIRIEVDPDQLEQLLINLIRNAVDATLETGGGVRVGWRNSLQRLDLWVEDEGPGIANSGNLFVPFFTTKKSGSGIGLVLCRQIAEAHNGTLSLENRRPGPGCLAHLSLPLAGVG